MCTLRHPAGACLRRRACCTSALCFLHRLTSSRCAASPSLRFACVLTLRGSKWLFRHNAAQEIVIEQGDERIAPGGFQWGAAGARLGDENQQH